MRVKAEAVLGPGGGAGPEVDGFYWDRLDIGKERGLGLGVKVRMGMLGSGEAPAVLTPCLS